LRAASAFSATASAEFVIFMNKAIKRIQPFNPGLGVRFGDFSATNQIGHRLFVLVTERA
jgi:hypothetical protein